MADPVHSEQCRLDPEGLGEIRENLPQVVAELVQTCQGDRCFEHVNPVPMPSLEKVVEVVRLTRRVLFPGYFGLESVDKVSLEYRLGQEACQLFDLVAEQCTLAIRHDCLRYGKSCTHCDRGGREAALAFLQSLPRLRGVLATDVRAAMDGDPAASSPDEVIFSYPGLFAIMVHRMAHVLYHLEIPLLPRIMSEHAHSRTGIDLHPAAEIGESFFIDHGTGVVVGQTTVIGKRVRLYQGVTLGALSLPPGAGRTHRDRKRHPTIGDDVIIYAGATILGGETVVGERSVVGGSVWLTESVPPDSKLLLKTPELIYQNGAAKTAASKKGAE